MKRPFRHSSKTLRWCMALCSSVVFLSVVHAEEMVMWWQVGDLDEGDELSDIQITTFHEGVKTAEDLGVTHARVRVVGTDQYLPVIDLDNPSGEPFPSSIVPGDAYSSVISPYAAAEYSFVIELGNWENDAWTMIATSEVASYTSLLDKGYIDVWSGQSMAPQNPGAWSAASYTVPEPSGGLLFIVGGGLLALRRRRLAL